MSKIIRLLCFLASLVSLTSVSATVVKYQFEGHFNTTEFTSIAVGDPFSGSLTLDYDAPWYSDLPLGTFFTESRYLHGLASFSFAFQGFSYTEPLGRDLSVVWAQSSGWVIPARSYGYSTPIFIDGGFLTPTIQFAYPNTGPMPADHGDIKYGDIVGVLPATAFELYVSAYLPAQNEVHYAYGEITKRKMTVLTAEVPESGSSLPEMGVLLGCMAWLRSRRARKSEKTRKNKKEENKKGVRPWGLGFIGVSSARRHPAGGPRRSPCD